MILNPYIYLQCFLLILWFHSSIIDTLSKIDLFAKFLRYEEYKKYSNNINIFTSYPEFLGLEYPNWIGKVANCTVCLIFWMTLATTTLSNSGFFAFFEIYVLTFTLYSLIRKIMP